jgi:hypothetical protein
VWYADDQRPIAGVPEERDPSLIWDAWQDAVARPFGRMFHPGRWIRRLSGSDHVPPAPNVNELDEVLNSSWFTNRIGIFPFSPPDAARGSFSLDGPDSSVPWQVIRLKTEGVTPGFNIRDGRGDIYVIKFDPPGYLNMTTAAGVIANRILHAAGYNVPGDYAVAFERSDLSVDSEATVRLRDGSRRSMTAEDLDEILGRVETLPDGRYLALASKFLDGRPLGPFDYKNVRRDDPNDRIVHENRRELRGLAVFAEWINHYDTKQHNSLDMLIEKNGKSYVKHYLIDFASTMGAGATGPFRRFGFEYTVDPVPILGRILALGFHEDPWRGLERPEDLSEVGYWESEIFRPGTFKPLAPNTSFVNLTPRDGYWAAKIVGAFRDEHLRAIVEQARFLDPVAADYMVRVLAARRDRIVEHWFDQVAPLDFFRLEAQSLTFNDLGQEYDLYRGVKTRYRFRLRIVDEDGHAPRSPAWFEQETSQIDLLALGIVPHSLEGDRFLELEVQVDRGQGWSDSAKAWFACGSGRLVRVRR